ncbi:MAG TPA: hypothetical protein PLZ21_02545, partial [Armatimonadota bacterium]|nr:hypothetical protein [Armatimonadota bacterium]
MNMHTQPGRTKLFLRLAIASVLALALILPQACLAQSETQPKSGHLLRVVYFIPTNREPQDMAIQRIKNYIKTIQHYYAMEMARNGFYKPGTTEGKTFAYEADENGEPLVHIVRGKFTDVEYKDGPAQFGMVAEEVSKLFDTKKDTFIVWTECCKIHPDSTISGPSCLGAAGEAPGGAGGMAILGSDGFPFLDTALFEDTRPVDGLVFPELGPYPLKHGVSYGGFAGSTVGSYASTCHGATGHELGHAFNLPHVFTDDWAPKIGGDLMGRGNQGFRGNFGNFPGEYAHILKENCEMLNVFRVFNPGEALTDTEPPKQKADVVVEDPMSKARKKINIKMTASDSGSGLYKAFAIVIPPWATIKSAPYNEKGIAEFSILPMDVPFEELKPKSYTLELLSFDNQGNRTLMAVWVPVPDFIAQQCLAGNDWGDLPAGCWSKSGKMR